MSNRIRRIPSMQVVIRSEGNIEDYIYDDVPAVPQVGDYVVVEDDDAGVELTNGNVWQVEWLFGTNEEIATTVVVHIK